MFLNNLATTLVFPLPADPDTRVWFLKYISLLLSGNLVTTSPKYSFTVLAPKMLIQLLLLLTFVDIEGQYL